MQTKDYFEGEIIRSWDDPEERQKIEASRTVTFKISSDRKDRHGTVMNMDNWQLDNFNRNGIVGYQHDVYGDNMCVPNNPDNVLGPGRAWLSNEGDKKVLMGSVTFETADVNPLADKIFKKVLGGSLRATSVGFLPIGKGRDVTTKDDKGNVLDKTHFFDGQELLEFSIVNIPSNPEATRKTLFNHTRSGINFLRNIGLSIADIRKVVNEILDPLDDKHEEESVTKGADPKLDLYKQRLTKVKK